MQDQATSGVAVPMSVPGSLDANKSSSSAGLLASLIHETHQDSDTTMQQLALPHHPPSNCLFISAVARNL